MWRTRRLLSREEVRCSHCRQSWAVSLVTNHCALSEEVLRSIACILIGYDLLSLAFVVEQAVSYDAGWKDCCFVETNIRVHGLSNATNIAELVSPVASIKSPRFEILSIPQVESPVMMDSDMPSPPGVSALRESFGDGKPPEISRKITACVACRRQKVQLDKSNATCN